MPKVCSRQGGLLILRKIVVLIMGIFVSKDFYIKYAPIFSLDNYACQFPEKKMHVCDLNKKNT
jgi:hypothetical protein